MKSDEKFLKQINKLYTYHNQLRQLIIDDTKHFSEHSLMKKITKWENESISKIHQTANDLRQQLKQVYTKHTIQLSKSFTKLSHDLNQARFEKHLLENDLNNWMNKLQELKIEFQHPRTINIHEEKYPNAFINPIKISQISLDTFHQSIGDINANNQAYTIVHGPTVNDATIRGKNEYYSGLHRFCFHIDRLGLPRWIFFGIISKNMPSETSLYRTSSVFGWAGHHQVWLNGKHFQKFNGYLSDMNENDTIEFSIDCDRQVISLKNQSTGSIYEMMIPIVQCPLPWVLYIGLYGANDQIRLVLA